MSASFLLFAALAALSAPESKDILCLKDGRIVQGKPMARTEAGIEITYENGRILVPYALILDAVLEADAQAPPLTEEEREQAQKGFVRFEGKWVTPKQREDAVAKRVEKHRLELEDVRAHGEWRNRRIQETRYFRFEYTVPQPIFEPYRDAMEAYFAEFLKTWKIRQPKAEERLPVCFYADEESFLQVGGVPKGVLGYFHPSRRDLNIFYERLDPALSEDVMFHEANHYLQQLIDPLFSMPHFPGESLAEYYGASSWDPVKKKLTVGLVHEHRLCEIQSDVDAGNRMDLVRLVSTEDLYEHYSWGWALVHFLMNDPRYTAKFQRFFLNLADAKKVERIAVGGGHTISQADVMTVFARELGLKDATAVRKLEAEWHDYIDSKLALVTHTGLARAGFRAKQDGRKIRATRLLNEAIEKGSRNPLVFHNLAEMKAEDGDLAGAEKLWRQALEIDPLNGLFYSRWAFYLASRNKKEEAQRMQALAYELGADDFWVFLELGDRKPEPEKKPPEGPGGPEKPPPPGGG